MNDGSERSVAAYMDKTVREARRDERRQTLADLLEEIDGTRGDPPTIPMLAASLRVAVRTLSAAETDVPEEW